MSDNIEFSRNLIKGRIAEIIFEQMFRESGKFTILRMGYEYTLPELAQYKQLPEVEKYLENIRHTPDFILISDDKKEAYVVEVKYRSHRKAEDTMSIASNNLKVWDPSWLFIASPDGFFFGPCNTIKNKCGEIGQLFEKWVDKETQDKYLKLMNEFEPKKQTEDD